MKILFLTLTGTLIHLAQRAQDEGHEVLLVHLKGPDLQHLPGEGFVDKVVLSNAASQEELLTKLQKADKDTLIVFDCFGLGKVADKLRESGYLVLGASSFHDAMYLNASFRDSLTKVAGVQVFAEEHKDLEVTIEGWFNGVEWIHHSASSYIEEKNFLVRNLGLPTECMGSTAWFWKHAKPKIFKNTLGKLTSILRNIHFVGPISMDTRGGECVSIFPGFRAESTQALFVHLREVGRLLYDCARGTLKQFKPEFLFSTSLRLSLPPYPYVFELENLRGERVDIDDDIRVLPNDLYRDTTGAFPPNKVAGFSGVIGSLVITAEHLSDLEWRVYDAVKKVRARNLQYRVDIVSRRARRDIPVLLQEVK